METNQSHQSPQSLSAEVPSLEGVTSPQEAQALSRDIKTVMGQLSVSSNGSVLITIDRADLGLDDAKLTLRETEFTPKAETHVTIVNFKVGQEIRKALRDPEQRERLENLVKELNGSSGIELTFDANADYMRLKKDVTGHHPGGNPFVEHRESLIRPIECPKAAEITAAIGKWLGRELESPFLHVTLYTHGSPHGIAVPNDQELQKVWLGQDSIPAAAVAELLGVKPQTERSIETQIADFIAVADRIRSGRGEAAPASSPQPALGRDILNALTSSAPIDALREQIERPEAAAALGKIIDLGGVEQDQRHHPEGNVLIHTLKVVAEAARLCDFMKVDLDSRQAALLGALLHDIGKGEPGVTRTKTDSNGATKITSYNHESRGVEPARQILESLGLSAHAPDVLRVVANHMILPHRVLAVQKGEMNRAVCVNRTREFIDDTYAANDPGILAICTIADWRGRGNANDHGKRMAIISDFMSVFFEAASHRGLDGGNALNDVA